MFGVCDSNLDTSPDIFAPLAAHVQITTILQAMKSWVGLYKRQELPTRSVVLFMKALLKGVIMLVQGQ